MAAISVASRPPNRQDRRSLVSLHSDYDFLIWGSRRAAGSGKRGPFWRGDRVLRIGCFGIEVEHILHAGDVFGIDLRNTPHVLAPGLEVVFGQTPAHSLAGKTVMCGELDQFTRQ